MRDKDYTSSSDFLKRLFGETLHNVELRAFPNVKGDPGTAKPVFTRDASEIEAFCSRNDHDGFGVYFGTCTRGARLTEKGAISGGVDNVVECPALWVDIDCVKQDLTGKEVMEALSFLPFAPSIVINSGGGLHVYWMLEAPVDISEGQPARSAVSDALKALAGVLAGDMKSTDLARVMRLPGTMNTKDELVARYGGKPALCEVLEDSGRAYDLEQLCEWLSDQRAVLHGKVEAPKPVREDDPFVQYARQAGYEPAIDIDAELAAMEYGGSERTAIHPTQLRVSASMIARGYEDDDIVDRILKATEAAAPRDKQWNWAAEERAIRKMISTGRGKGYAEKRRDMLPAQAMTSGNAALKLVHDADAEPKKAKEPKPDKTNEISQAGEAVILAWQDRHGPLMHAKGTSWAYADGIWREFDDDLVQRMRSVVQEACASCRIKPSTSNLNAIYRYVMERPSLRRDRVEFDKHGLLVAADACLDLATFEVIPHAPGHYATLKVAATLEGARTRPQLENFLNGCFSDRGEAPAIILTLQEWFGAAIMPLAAKKRGEKRGLICHGPSRTGKTQISELARHLLGHEHVSGARMADLEDRFGVEPLIGKRGWIADDAISEAEYLNADDYKKIVTGEQMGCKRKGGKNWEGRFGIPVCLTANGLPRVKDQSEAVYNRSLILPMTKVRGEREPEPAGYDSISAKIAAEELTGLLWWAIEGWQRLSARGFYDPPAVMTEASEALQNDNNPVGAWLKECVEIVDDTMVSRIDLAASFNGWRTLEHDDAKPWTQNTITRRIAALLPGHIMHKQNGERMVTRVRLNEDGLFAWQRAKDTAGFDRKVTYSTQREDVNRDWAMPTETALKPGDPLDRRPRF